MVATGSQAFAGLGLPQRPGQAGQALATNL